MTETQPQWRRILSFPNVLTGVYFLALLIQVHHHIMWRDEVRTWQICREATGLNSLAQLMKFDAVPFLWNWIVFALTRITDNPASMQYVHGMIAAALVYVVARWAPFSKVNKTLFAFGYFPFFEYAVIARSYGLLFLLLMIACVLISRQRVLLLALAGVCFLMAQVSVWGVGFAILCYLIGVAKARWCQHDPPVPWGRVTTGLGIIILGIIVCAAQLFPGPGKSFRDQWRDVPAIDHFLFPPGTIYRAWIPIPDIASWTPLPKLVPHFWNTNITDSYAPLGPIQAPVGFLLFGIAALLLIRRPVALALLVCGMLGLLLFSYVSFRGYTRHFGHLFMVLIAAYWLAETSPAVGIDWAQRFRGIWLNFILGLGALVGVTFAYAALFQPFSATWATAEYLKENVFKHGQGSDVVLSAMYDYPSSPISQWLDRPIYYFEEHQFGTYYSQDDAIRRPVFTHAGDILNDLYEVALSKHKRAILMLNGKNTFPFKEDAILTVPLRSDGRPVNIIMNVLPVFKDSVVEDESQTLYIFGLDEGQKQ